MPVRRTTARTVAALAAATILCASGGGSASAGSKAARAFDLQAHRGGIGLTVENTIASFSRALDLGVSTLQLDVQITRDGHAVVTHDRDPVGRRHRS